MSIMSFSYAHQRVAVFIDTSNLYHTAKHVFGGRVQFQSLLESAERGRALVRALAYTVSTEGGEEKNFTDSLRALGIEIRTKELVTYKNGDKKADWDVGIAIDAISIAPHVDVVVLVSGDGDFVPLVKHLREQGVRVEVMAFDQSVSQSLIDVADEYIDMSLEPDVYVFSVRQFQRKQYNNGPYNGHQKYTDVPRIPEQEHEILQSIQPNERSAAHTTRGTQREVGAFQNSAPVPQVFTNRNVNPSEAKHNITYITPTSSQAANDSVKPTAPQGAKSAQQNTGVKPAVGKSASVQQQKNQQTAKQTTAKSASEPAKQVKQQNSQQQSPRKAQDSQAKNSKTNARIPAKRSR